MSVAEIARMLHRRPPQGRFRDQLFWLVDLVYACKASGDASLTTEAQLVEDALGKLGEFLETGDTVALDDATAQVERFASHVNAVVATGSEGEWEGHAGGDDDEH